MWKLFWNLSIGSPDEIYSSGLQFERHGTADRGQETMGRFAGQGDGSPVSLKNPEDRGRYSKTGDGSLS